MKVRILLLMVGLTLLSYTVCFAETRVAVVNSREILTKCNAGARLVKEIQEKFATRRQEMSKLEQWAEKLKTEAAESDTKAARKKEIQGELMQIGEKIQQFTRDVAQEENVRFKPIVDKVNQALGDYAKEKGLSGIQDRSSYIYVDQNIDITEEIVKKVDQMR